MCVYRDASVTRSVRWTTAVISELDSAGAEMTSRGAGVTNVRRDITTSRSAGRATVTCREQTRPAVPDLVNSSCVLVIT